MRPCVHYSLGGTEYSKTLDEFPTALGFKGPFNDLSRTFGSVDDEPSLSDSQFPRVWQAISTEPPELNKPFVKKLLQLLLQLHLCHLI